MRIAVLSDVHANLEALVEVEAAIERLGVDQVACLGDVVGYGASPVACCERIRRLATFTLLGNHDAAVAGRMEYAYYYDAARHALDWTARLLDDDTLLWLRALPYTQQQGDTVFSHGSPIAPADYGYVFALEQARELASHMERLADVTLIGHSHLCKAFALEADGACVEDVSAPSLELAAGRKYVVSVGSVGQPRDYDNRACFVIYDTGARRLEYHRVPYDIERSARRIVEAGLPANFARRLYLGV